MDYAEIIFLKTTQLIIAADFISKHYFWFDNTYKKYTKPCNIYYEYQ